VEPDLIPDRDVLPIRHDAARAVDVTTYKVLEHVVAVEATASLTELSDPRPHPVSARANRDRPRGGDVGVGDEVVTRKVPVRLLLGRAPLELPRPDHEHIGGRRVGNRIYAGAVWMFHAPTSRPCDR
jgi:hypothetical protein